MRIRDSFRQEVLKLHPDRNKNRGAHEQFVLLNESYEILRNPILRRKYDLLVGNLQPVFRKKPRPDWNAQRLLIKQKHRGEEKLRKVGIVDRITAGLTHSGQ